MLRPSNVTRGWGKVKYSYFFLIVLSAILVAGCANKTSLEPTDHVDNYDDVRVVAWAYVKEKGWDTTAEDDWHSADVKETIADNRYVLLDKKYKNQEVLVVSFKDVKNVVTGTPEIVVDSNTYEVIGYMPTE